MNPRTHHHQISYDPPLLSSCSILLPPRNDEASPPSNAAHHYCLSDAFSPPVPSHDALRSSANTDCPTTLLISSTNYAFLASTMMDSPPSHVSVEAPLNAKVEKMVSLFETKAKKLVHRSSVGAGSPTAVKTDDLRALVSVPQSSSPTSFMIQAPTPEHTAHKLLSEEASPRIISVDGSSLSKDVEMAKIKKEKILNLIKAWEESKKKRSLYRYNKRMAKLDAWEVGKIARAEARLRTSEERLENKRATCVERARNKIAVVHKIAEEQRALVEARHGQEMVNVEETAAKCRTSGRRPWNSLFLCC